jgi:hypothetical protein
MIHRIESAYLRTQDSLSKHGGQERRRRQPPRTPHSDPGADHPDGPVKLEEESESVALDLVA